MSQPLLMLFTEAALQTLYMVVISGTVGTLIGLPLGMLMFVTQPGHFLEQKQVQRILGAILNGVRSIPYLVLMVALIPLSRFLVGSSIGTNAAIVSLTVGAIPLVAQLVQNALQEVPQGLIEAGLAMGASPQQIMWKILLPESLPGIINGITLLVVALVGYSAMAGAIGGGGLGDLAYRYGVERFNVTVMIWTIVILIIMVQLFQLLGNKLAKSVDHRRG